MPYRIKKQDCINSKGESGAYVVQKKKSGKWKKSSCHTSYENAKGSISARGASKKNEGSKMKIPKTRVMEIIREELAKTFGGSQPDETYELGTSNNLMLDIPTQHGGWPEGEYDPPVNKRIYDYLKSIGIIQEQN